MISVEVPLSCKVGTAGSPLWKNVKGSDLTNVTPELLILKGDEALGIKRLPIFIALASQFLKMTVEQMEMEVTPDAILLPEIIYENEMMRCIDHLSKEVVPVLTHT